MTYTPSMVRGMLAGYQRRAQGARQSPPEDRLGTQAPPLGKAAIAAQRSFQGATYSMAQAILSVMRLLSRPE